MNVIVTRHPGAVEWLRAKGIAGRIVEHLTPDDIGELRRGDAVYGVLPLPLISLLLSRGVSFYLLALPEVPADLRGVELSPADMDRMGARMFMVRGLDLVPV